MRDSLWFFLLVLLFSRVFFIFHFELEERTKGFGEGQIKGGEERVGNCGSLVVFPFKKVRGDLQEEVCIYV